jgi:hypothetical protein
MNERVTSFAANHSSNVPVEGEALPEYSERPAEIYIQQIPETHSSEPVVNAIEFRIPEANPPHVSTIIPRIKLSARKNLFGTWRFNEDIPLGTVDPQDFRIQIRKCNGLLRRITWRRRRYKLSQYLTFISVLSAVVWIIADYVSDKKVSWVSFCYSVIWILSAFISHVYYRRRIQQFPLSSNKLAQELRLKGWKIYDFENPKGSPIIEIG